MKKMSVFASVHVCLCMRKSVCTVEVNFRRGGKKSKREGFFFGLV